MNENSSLLFYYDYISTKSPATPVIFSIKFAFNFLAADFLAPKSGPQRENQPVLESGMMCVFLLCPLLFPCKDSRADQAFFIPPNLMEEINSDPEALSTNN